MQLTNLVIKVFVVVVVNYAKHHLQNVIFNVLLILENKVDLTYFLRMVEFISLRNLSVHCIVVV